MRVYLIRHGKAEESGEVRSDFDRALTTMGRDEVTAVARRLGELRVKPTLVLTSPLLRARETAELLAAEWAGATLEVRDELAPGEEIAGFLPWLSRWRAEGGGDLVLVGHAPTLGDWAEHLVWGSSRGRLPVKKAGVVGVELPDSGDVVGRGELFWLTSPKLLL
jgi:phosphohistidine phosphatase